jgi:hypothetical protein
MAGEGPQLRSGLESNGTSTPSTVALLDILHFNYPWVLCLIFVVAFVANSVLTADPAADSGKPTVTGPGGKPLPRSPKRKAEEEERLRRKRQDFSPLRKLLFYWLAAGVIATFIANAANIVIHALKMREDGWWCGKATAVRGNWILSPLRGVLADALGSHHRSTSAVRRFSIACFSSP